MTTARLAANIFGRTRVYYKGYEGSIEKDQDGTKWGKILKIRDLVTYEDAGEGIIKSFIKMKSVVGIVTSGGVVRL